MRLMRITTVEPNARLLSTSKTARNAGDQAGAAESVIDGVLENAASSVRLATAAARHTWNNVLVRPK